MKKLIYPLLAVLALTFTACSSSNDDDVTETGKTVASLSLKQAPDLTLYSNGNYIAGTGTRATVTDVDVASNILYNRNTVEINYSISDPKEDIENQGSYLSTKLSIHVRECGDVFVTIPVAANWYAKALDEDGNEVNASEFAVKYTSSLLSALNSTQEFEVNGEKVKFELTYSDAGIKVNVIGVTAKMLSYLKAQYGDNKVNVGLTFEIRNYFDSYTDAGGTKHDISVATLKEALGQPIAVIETNGVAFDEQLYAYINSFGKKDGKQNPNDVAVLLNQDEDNGGYDYGLELILDENDKPFEIGQTYYYFYTWPQDWADIKEELSGVK